MLPPPAPIVVSENDDLYLTTVASTIAGYPGDPEQIDRDSFATPRVSQNWAMVVGALVRHRCEVAYALGENAE